MPLFAEIGDSGGLNQFWRGTTFSVPEGARKIWVPYEGGKQ
jgi:hypothetical protein